MLSDKISSMYETVLLGNSSPIRTGKHVVMIQYQLKVILIVMTISIYSKKILIMIFAPDTPLVTLVMAVCCRLLRIFCVVDMVLSVS